MRIFPTVLVLAVALTVGCVTRKKMWNAPSDAGDVRTYSAPYDKLLMATQDAVSESGFTKRQDEQISESTRQFLYSQGLEANTGGRYVRLRLQKGASDVTVWVHVKSKFDSSDAAVADGAIARDIHSRIAKRLGLKDAVGVTPPVPPTKSETPLPDLGPAPALSNNNKTVTLGRGIYRGKLTISGNKNQLVAEGVGQTILAGDLVILGNSNTVSGLTVRGKITITGNNNQLRDVARSSAIEDNGKNNVY